jgi:hypothetical protein
VPRRDLDRQVRAGTFSTVETCDDDDERIEALHLSELYFKKMEVSGCSVYWVWGKKQEGTAPKH